MWKLRDCIDHRSAKLVALGERRTEHSGSRSDSVTKRLDYFLEYLNNNNNAKIATLAKLLQK